MKVFYAIFLFMTFYITLIIFLSVKQNLGHGWFLGPYTLDKLILPIVYLSIKQTLIMFDFSNHIPWVN